MKRIVVCFDGTWNKPSDENLPDDQQIETNVRRFYESVKNTGADGAEQVKWYDEGVGTKWYDRFIGGAFGTGLELNIIEGYKFLAKAYKEGDEVYILGFSRGAYTARSLVGMIRNCGLVKNKRLGSRVAMSYGIYRTRGDSQDSIVAKAFKFQFSRDIRVKFLGVWDTVGALGIPLDILEQANMKFYEFHDTKLSGIVENAYHAIAVDEHRKHYDVCLWKPHKKSQSRMEQRWFAGAHSDVGGGYPDRRLSDITLRWIQDKAIAFGLALNPVKISDKNHLGQLTDSYAEFLKGIYAKGHPRYFRAISTTEFGNEVLDDTVQQRQREDVTYRPQNPGFPPLIG
jgi:uncharacterized protein (DUF2235 family)